MKLTLFMPQVLGKMSSMDLHDHRCSRGLPSHVSSSQQIQTWLISRLASLHLGFLQFIHLGVKIHQPESMAIGRRNFVAKLSVFKF